jgi:hypothetical protein
MGRSRVFHIKDLAIFEAGEPARLGSSLCADFRQ